MNILACGSRIQAQQLSSIYIDLQSHNSEQGSDAMGIDVYFI